MLLKAIVYKSTGSWYVVRDESGKEFVAYDIFEKSTQSLFQYRLSATDVTVLALDFEALSSLMEEAPDFITVHIPYQDEILEVRLYKQTVLTDDFEVRDAERNLVNYQPGEYYRGVVAGTENSLADSTMSHVRLKRNLDQRIGEQ